MTSERPQLDHVVILLPYKDVVNPPNWITDHFVVSPGGRHADGKTENKLILFQDGTYAELIAFIDDDPERRKGHWWDKPYGVVDYALTTPGTEPDVHSINTKLQEAGTGLAYDEPREGGRKRPDGVELKWEVTFPKGIERGAIPFWCHDVTPRQNRVPVDQKSTQHPCGSPGMAGVGVGVDTHRIATLNKAFAAMTGDSTDGSGRYQIDDPIDVPDKKPTLRLHEVPEASEDTLKLALVIQIPQGKRVPNINQEINGGTVNILFESQ